MKFIELLDDVLAALCEVLTTLVFSITLPIWIIPYLIYKRFKKGGEGK